MSGRRNRTQARRTGGNGMPGWAWLVVGLLLGAGALWAGSAMLAGDNDFLRPTPDPDARPAAEATDEGIAAEDAGTRFDFYTLLPGDGVAMSDEELAASARAEAEAADAGEVEDDPAAEDEAELMRHPDAADLAEPEAGAVGDDVADQDGARYVLQAGAFGDAGDAEAVKARIALLGLGARVEPAAIDGGRTVYRVRMGPYASAAELAEAKRKLAEGGLPSLAIRAR